MDAPATLAVGSGGDMALVDGRTFAHADQAAAVSGAPPSGGGCAEGTGVLDVDVDRAVPDGHPDAAGGVGGGVLEGVGEGFLDDAVDGELEAGGQRGQVSVGAEGDTRAGGADAFDQRVEVGQAGLRGERGPVRPVVVVADDGQETAQFGKGAAAAVSDNAQGLGTALGLCLGQARRRRRRARR